MDKEEDENETNKRQDDSSGQQSAVDNPSEDGCYIHVCGTSAQLLHMLSHIDMCTSTPVEVLELESLSEESESCQSSSPSSMTSTTPNSMSDETNYVIWAEPIMTCRLVPANPNGMADVRRLPPGARKVLPTTQTASTSCTTSNSSSGMPGTCRSSEIKNLNRRAMGDSTASHHTIFSEALKKMASAADTIRQAKDVLSTLAVTREANNNNKTESSIGGDDNANEGSTRDPATESSTHGAGHVSANKSQNSQKEADNHEIGKQFPEPILVRSFTNADNTLSLNSNSVDTKNMSMGDSGLSRSTLMTHASQSQQQSPRHQPHNRLRPHVLSNRATWSSNMLDSDYQAARVARYLRLYDPTYRRMMESKAREENGKSLQPQNTEAKDLGSYRFTDTSILQKSLLNVGINSNAPAGEVENRATVERRIPSVTKSCSTTIRNKITIVDLRAALDLAIRNLEKNDLWKSYNNNTYISASQGTKVSSNSFQLCPLGDLSLPRSCQQGSRTSGSPIENTKTENLRPPSNEAVVFKQHVEPDQNGASCSGETGVGSANTDTVPKRSCSSFKTDFDERIESVYERTPETQAVISKQRKTVEFLIPLAEEIEYTRQPTDRPESRGSTTGQPGSLLEQDDATVEKEKSLSGDSEETSFLCSAQYEVCFRPIKETRDFSCYINLANDEEPAASLNETYGNNSAGADIDSSENLTYGGVKENVVASTDQRDLGVSCQKTFTLHRSLETDGNKSMSPCQLEDEKVKSAFREVVPSRRKVIITPESHVCNGAFGEGNAKDFSKGDDYHDKYSTWQSHVLEEPTNAVAPPCTDNIRPMNSVSVYQSDLFEESPLTLMEDSGGDWPYRNMSITCDKIMSAISEDDIKETEYFKIDPKLDLESTNKGYAAAENTPIGDYSRLKAADVEKQDTDDESELVTMRSVSVSMSAASELSKFSLRASHKRLARKYFHDRHISDLFRPSELDLLSEPLVIDFVVKPLEESRNRSVQKETIIEMDEIETIELGDETLNQTDQKPETKIFVTQSGTQLKSILAIGQQKAKILTPTRVIARDLELVSIIGEDSDEEVKKVRWDMLSEPSSANSNDPKAVVKYTSSSTSLVADDGDAGDETSKEKVEENPKIKRQPIRARIGRFLKSCLRLSN